MTVKTKIIFINTMGVLTNNAFYKDNEKAFKERSLSESLVKLLKNVVQDYNVKLVFLEAWAEDSILLKQKIREAGFKDIDLFFHSMIQHPVGTFDNKSASIDKVIGTSTIDFVVLDNDTQKKNYTTNHQQKGIFTNIELGLTSSDLLKLRELIES